MVYRRKKVEVVPIEVDDEPVGEVVVIEPEPIEAIPLSPPVPPVSAPRPTSPPSGMGPKAEARWLAERGRKV